MYIYLAITKKHDVVGVFSTQEAAETAVAQLLEASLRAGQTLSKINDDQWVIYPDERESGDTDVDGTVGTMELDSMKHVTRYAASEKRFRERGL